MSDTRGGTEAARAYAAAYAARYSERDWITALQLCTTVTASHASAREAGYSRARIQNIVNALVPAQDLVAAHLNLALARVE